jgi:hypothetical protein
MVMKDSEVILTIDVEWAHPAVLADVVGLLDERGLRCTFFCTHEGISVPGHERALHPNFRRSANTLFSDADPAPSSESDPDFYRVVIERTHAFCPEAVGVRAHSLFQDSALLDIYRASGLQYDSTCLLPLVDDLAPFWMGRGILELPLYYMDHWDLTEGSTRFALAELRLDRPGLKILGFHPNLVFINAANEGHYLDTKQWYHDPDWLCRKRHPGRGVRTLFLDLLDQLARRSATPVLSEVNRRFRGTSRPAFQRGAA